MSDPAGAPRRAAGRMADAAYRFGIAWRGSAYWHWRYYGWDYRAQRVPGGWTVQVLGRERQVLSLQGWQAGADSLHILLSGPSAARVAVADLASHPVIAVNGSYRLLRDAGRPLDLYLVSDIGFVRRQWDSFVEGVRMARAVALDHRVLLEVMRHDAALLDTVELRLFDNLQRPYGRSSHWWEGEIGERVAHASRDCAFSVDADAGYFPSCTVAYLALQIAATQRPRRVVFFGLDLNGGARYYAETNPEKSLIGNDLERSIVPHFGFASAVLAGLGIVVLNASPDSALPDSVFPRVDPAWMFPVPP